LLGFECQDFLKVLNRNLEEIIFMKDIGLLILRVFAGGFMIYGHGFPKLLRLFSGTGIKFADPLGIGTGLSFGLTVFAEFFCSIFVILGLFTRASLIPLIIAMFVAGLIHHVPDPFSVKEKALLFLIVFITLMLTGPGKYSLSNLLAVKYRKL
jgi:putative oxidoreductase